MAEDWASLACADVDKNNGVTERDDEDALDDLEADLGHRSASGDDGLAPS